MFEPLLAGGRSLSEAILSFAQGSHRRAALVLVLASLLCCLPGFFTIPPTDRDESRFAQASKQMVETGNFIDIRFQGEARHKKPVGIYWLQAAAVKVSGLGAAAPIWVYRLPSLFAAIAAVLLTYWALLPVIGQRESLIAALLLAGTVMLGFEAKIAKTDAVLLATIVGAMGALLRAVRDPQAARRGAPSLIFWIAIGIGLLIKGPVTAMVAVLSGLAIAARRRSLDFVKALRPWRGITIALLIALPWFIAIAFETGGAFFKESIGHDLLAKIGDSAEQHWGPPGYYLALLWIFAWPAAPFLPLVFGYLWRHRRSDDLFLLLAWLAPTWLVFEIFSTKLPHYVLPTYPALAGLIALGLVRGEEEISTRRRGFWLAGLALFPFLLSLAAIIALFRGEGMVSQALLAFGGLATLYGAIAVAIGRQNLASAVPAAILTAALSAAAIFHVFIPAMSQFWLSPRVAVAINEVKTCPGPALASAGYHEPSLVFLTRTDLLLTDGVGAAAFLAEGGCRLAILDAIPSGNGAPSDNDLFLASLAGRGKEAQMVAEISGRNVNGLKPRRLLIWRPKP